MSELPRLCFLTHDIASFTHEEQARRFVVAGGRWVQFRAKGLSAEEWRKAAARVVAICRSAGAQCIINDSVNVALEAGAHGVHLGKTDGDLGEARRRLGKDKVIGATVNSLECLERIEAGLVDYIGLGPYRFTATKENLSSILGLDGIQKILTVVRRRFGGMPVVAIGGVRIEDVRLLRSVGVYGVAVASSITSSPEGIEAATRSFMNSLDNGRCDQLGDAPVEDATSGDKGRTR